MAQAAAAGHLPFQPTKAYLMLSVGSASAFVSVASGHIRNAGWKPC
jgi:hypothetical protein